jgi:hypothetical protein
MQRLLVLVSPQSLFTTPLTADSDPAPGMKKYCQRCTQRLLYCHALDVLALTHLFCLAEEHDVRCWITQHMLDIPLSPLLNVGSSPV